VLTERLGSCGTAALLKQRVIVSDIATDPLWADYRDLALSHGLRAAWSQPQLSKNQEIGRIGISQLRQAAKARHDFHPDR
jgi:hypothetical protein